MKPAEPIPMTTSSRSRGAGVLLLLPLLVLGACSSDTPAPAAPASTLNTYFGPAVSTNLFKTTVAIDRVANTFVQYQFSTVQYVANSGTLTPLANGILNLALTYVGGNGTQGTLFSPGQAGNYAVEWPGQIGLVGLLGQPVTPIVPNQTCPTLSAPATYLFVTLPIAGDATGTAYGTTTVATSGAKVNFSAINQLNIAGGAALNPSTVTVAATCSPTFYGQTISAPDVGTVTNPGNGQTVSPSATISIGPSGFLVEDNGYAPSPLAYQNALGAGTGAIGLPAASAPLTTSALTAAQYTGFIYGTGAAGNAIKNLAAVPASTRVASFGSSTPCSTPPVAAGSTVIFGGDFSGNNPVTNSSSNCDLAVDLGAQSAAFNGLYPAAVVSLGATFPGNTSGKTYSFSAVAIAGQIRGKTAIFLLGLDRTGLQVVSQGQQSQDWGIYLLQSN